MVLVLWTAIEPQQLRELMDSGCFTTQFAIAFPILGACNFPVDYVSLLETRFAIAWLGKRSTVLGIITVLLLDLAVTCGIAVFAMQFLWHLNFPFPLGLRDSLYILCLPGTDCDILPYGIWFYAAFFTSVWVWLYAASGLIVRLAQRMDIWSDCLRRLLDIDRKPFQSIGVVAIMLVTLLFILFAPVVLRHTS